MAYVTQAGIEAEIPGPHLVEALDDDGDGLMDTGALDQVIANASAAVDALIAGAYTVPLADPAPAMVQRAALVFACETIYRRRQVPEERNPFAKESGELRVWLMGVGRGEQKLDVGTDSGLTADYGGETRVEGRI